MIYLKHIEVNIQDEKIDDYPFNIPLFKEGFTLRFSKNVTIINGDNGTGKSTILKYIANNIGFNLDGGNSSSNYNSYTKLPNAINFVCSWMTKTKQGFYFKSDTFDSYYKYIEQNPDIAKYYSNKFSELSHGESFLKLFTSFNNGIFLLDEPESSLSPQNQLTFLKIIHDLDILNNSQIIILTHSPIIMSYPDADFYEINHDTLQSKSFKDTDHYVITKKMINSPESIFNYLFAKDDED